MRTVYEVSGGDAYGMGGLVELPKGEGATDRDTDPQNNEEGCGVLCGDAVPEAEDVASVMDAEPCSDCMTNGAADGEANHELLA